VFKLRSRHVGPPRRIARGQPGHAGGDTEVKYAAIPGFLAIHRVMAAEVTAFPRDSPFPVTVCPQDGKSVNTLS
jgi:hypothetical protein